MANNPPINSALPSKDAERMVGHILSEMRTLDECLASRRPSTLHQDTIETESALMHIRVLKYFLFGAWPRKEDDVFALDYLPAGESPPAGAKNSTLERNVTRINKALAHLTLSRGTQPWKKWPLAEMRNELRGLFRQVWNKMRPIQKKWFETEAKRIRFNLGPWT